MGTARLWGASTSKGICHSPVMKSRILPLTQVATLSQNLIAPSIGSSRERRHMSSRSKAAKASATPCKWRFEMATTSQCYRRPSQANWAV